MALLEYIRLIFPAAVSATKNTPQLKAPAEMGDEELQAAVTDLDGQQQNCLALVPASEKILADHDKELEGLRLASLATGDDSKVRAHQERRIKLQNDVDAARVAGGYFQTGTDGSLKYVPGFVDRQLTEYRKEHNRRNAIAFAEWERKAKQDRQDRAFASNREIHEAWLALGLAWGRREEIRREMMLQDEFSMIGALDEQLAASWNTDIVERSGYKVVPGSSRTIMMHALK
jgi:hypothetical protein